MVQASERSDPWAVTSTAPPLVRAVRPRQWSKNVLVLAAPAAAGVLGDTDVLLATAIAFVAFCLAASAVYLLNDCVDVDSDRRHPEKRRRPVAAGELSLRSAYAVAGILAAAAVALATVGALRLLLVVVLYLALQASYAVWLKHEAVLDIAVVASGFLLRGVAGGLAADLPISRWFLLVAGFGSLFIVAGKRYSELVTLGREAGTRRSLVGYTEGYLRFVWGIAAGSTIMSYALWAISEQPAETTWTAVSIAPFVLGMLRYAVVVDVGLAGEPEDVVWRDRVLQLVGLVWVATVMAGVMGA